MTKDKRVFHLFPVGGGAMRWVYLIGHPDGAIKIGPTGRPRARTNTHRSYPGLKWCHLFPGGSRYFANVAERHGIEVLGKLGKRRGHQEVFTGIKKATAIEAVRAVVLETHELSRRFEQERLAARAANAAWVAFRAQYVHGASLPTSANC